VCGCGLDTVPCPGPSTSGDAGADAELEADVAGVILDVAALAHKLKKPLACRLLPLPGKVAGDATSFANPYLLDSRVLPLR
jgi:uncharacterized protein (UPF0210 family)